MNRRARREAGEREMPVVAELGHKLRPLAIYPEFLPAGHRYVGVEHGPALRRQFELDARIHRRDFGSRAPQKSIVASLERQLAKARQRAEGMYPGRVQFKEVTKPSIPLANNGAREVWAANVLSDPTVKAREIAAMLSEVQRVLETGGSLVVVEDTTGRSLTEIEKRLGESPLEAEEDKTVREAFAGRVRRYLKENEERAQELWRRGQVFSKFNRLYVLAKRE